MNRLKSIRWAALVLSMAMTAASVGGQQQPAQPSQRDAPQLARQSLGAGNWQSHRDAVGRRNWQVQLKHFDDDSLTGRLTVVGSARVRQAKIIGQISGTDVYGVMVNDNNVQMGTFTGTVSEGGMSGTYTTADGDTGDWSSNQAGR